LTGVPTNIQTPNCSGSLSGFFCVLSNIGVFFQLMQVSSTYAMLGTVLFTPLLISMIWLVLSLLRGVD
jgi:hypothetical protein